jgi:hypothetical protein
MYKSVKMCIECFPGYFPGQKGREIVEYAPVKLGRWKLVDFAGNMRCSVCGEVDGEFGYEYNYCPNCGARMDR